MKNFLLRFNWALLLCVMALIGFGIVFIGSAGSTRTVAALQNAWRAHALTAVFGLGLMFLLAAVDYRKLLDWAAIPGHVLSLVLLVTVLQSRM